MLGNRRQDSVKKWSLTKEHENQQDDFCSFQKRRNSIFTHRQKNLGQWTFWMETQTSTRPKSQISTIVTDP